MTTLKLNNLRCIRQQDVSGLDEPRIKVNDQVVWNGAIDKGGDKNLAPTSVSFSKEAKIKLEEMNGSKAKVIGSTVTVYADRPAAQPATFKTSGSHYELFYEVD